MIKKILAYSFIIGGVLMLSALSFWQVERLSWKENLIQEIELGLANPAKAISNKKDIGNLSLYSKVTLRGEFLYNYERYLQPRVRSSKRGDAQQGVEHLVPFLLNDKRTIVFVNRGWFPKSITASDAILDRIPRPTGQQNIMGVIHPVPRGNIFTPQNDFDNDYIYWADIKGLMNHYDMNERAYGYLLKEIMNDNSSQSVYLPQKFDAEITMANNHKKYAYFWGSMAIIWAGFGVMFIRKRKGY